MKLTITVDRTVRARLFSVAFDLFSAAFVACACHAPPLLEWLWLGYLAVDDFVGGRIVVFIFGTLLVLRWFILTILA